MLSYVLLCYHIVRTASHGGYAGVLSFLQKKPPGKRGPPGLQKRGNVSDWQVKNQQEAAVGREEEQEEETQTVIRYNLNSMHYVLCISAADIATLNRKHQSTTRFRLVLRCCRSIIVHN